MPKNQTETVIDLDIMGEDCAACLVPGSIALHIIDRNDSAAQSFMTTMAGLTRVPHATFDCQHGKTQSNPHSHSISPAMHCLSYRDPKPEGTCAQAATISVSVKIIPLPVAVACFLLISRSTGKFDTGRR